MKAGKQDLLSQLKHMANEEIKLKGLREAWLSPSGKLVVSDKEVADPFAWHLDIGCAIVRDLQGLKTSADGWEYATISQPFETTVDYLESIGWIRLHQAYGIGCRWIKKDFTKRLPKRQENVIVDWCNANNIEYEKAFIYM